MTEIKNRFDFVLLFDVKDGNPNGDPDAGNLPRIDPETGHGLVTDVCLKRKIRNFVLLTKGRAEGFDIFVKEKAILNRAIDGGYKKAGIDLEKPPNDESDGKKRTKPGVGQGSEVDKARTVMCQSFYDVRTFGAVMSTGANAGQVRGPVQLTFARSIDPIVTLEHSVTRMAVTTDQEAESQRGENRTMGRKNTVPYGLYKGYGFVSPSLAKQTGFSEEDLGLFWSALKLMFEHDRSAARGLMGLRKLVIFKHASELGSAPAHALFDLVNIERKDTSKPVRSFTDYLVTIGRPPAGVETMDLPLA
jgi:CRISPR-associated protein Csd2